MTARAVAGHPCYVRIDERASFLVVAGEAGRLARRVRPEVFRRGSCVRVVTRHALEPRPSEELVREGFDPRAYGIFEGNMHDEDAPVPTCITLFTHNLLADFDDDELEEQLEITILHEVGHYFGLDEDDMERLGLD